MSSSSRQRVEQIPSRPGADEVEVADYLWALWRYRLFIVVTTAVCAIVAFGAALASDKVYQATAVVSAAPPGGGELPFAVISQVRNLLQSASVAERALARHPEASVGLTPGVFISKNLSVERNRDTNLWMVTVRLSDPVAAADTANLLSEEAVAAHQRSVEEQQQVPAADPRQIDPLLVEKVAQMRKREASSRQALVRFQAESRLEERRASRAAATRVPQEIAAIAADLSSERAAVAQVEADLRRQPEFVSVSDSDDAPAIPGAPRRQLNPVYIALTTRLADSRARIAALEERQLALRAGAAIAARDGADVPTLELRFADLQREHQRALGQLEALTSQLDQASEAAAHAKGPAPPPPTAVVSLTQRATPPASPIAPRPLRSLMLGLAFGLFVSIIGALVLDSIRLRPPVITEDVSAA
jgi:uncharacterized protein involved in exopolysaccharide biosynthesis